MSYVDVTEYINSTYTPSTGKTATSELGQDAFMTLLLAQLGNQDPLNPMDDTEMVSQLAQFSSLESLEAIEELVGGVATLMADNSLLNATSYIGMEVEAKGSSIGKTDDGVSVVTYTLSSDAETVYAYVVTEDGDIVATEELGARDEGDYTFVWDGNDDDGVECDNGSYAVAFVAENADGEKIYVSTMVSGTVTQAYTKDGETYLGLGDDRIVNLDNVTRVVDSSVAAAEEADDEEDA